MFRVELLDGGSAAPTPGWTYVADRGRTQAAAAPTLSRKRGIRDAGKGGDISSRRANAIARHIAELDRENQRDVAIPVPVKQAKEAGARGTRAKTTSNVRRILQSQKTFRNHLDDEEAAINNAGGAVGTTQVSGGAAAAAAKNNKVTAAAAAAVARRSSTPATTPSASTTGGKNKKRVSAVGAAAEKSTSATEESEAMDVDAEESAPKLLKTEHDNDPLLKSYTPSMPSDRLIQKLLAEPPLTYNASRAGPRVVARAPRHFCCMCGYWGKIRCKNCHLRTCGLDCYRVHEDSRCGAFF